MSSDDPTASATDAPHGTDSDDDSAGTGLNGRAYPQHDKLLEQLPPAFTDAIQALQRPKHCPDARVVAVSEDRHKDGAGFVIISLGVWLITDYADYDHEEVEVFVRVKQNFPDGKKYGFITDPVVRVDGDFPDGKTEVNRPIADPLLEELDVDDVLVWSRSWKPVDVNDPEDLRKATGLTRRILSKPFEDED